MKRTLIQAVLLVAVLVIALVLAANVYINDRSVPVTRIAGQNDRVLAVFAHPDDEIMVAGTFAKFHANNIPTGLVYLTRGEAGPTGGLVSQHELGQARTKEVHAIKDILGVDYMRVLDFPDSGVPESSSEAIKTAMLDAIEEFKPTVIIGFDKDIGLYGHEDHRLAGLYLHQLLVETNPVFVKKHYMVTLPPSLIELALKMSTHFKERYSKGPSRGLPKADVAVNIWRFSSTKKSVLLAHKTQWEVIDDVQPFGMVTPAYLYYGIFDREYFHHVLH